MNARGLNAKEIAEIAGVVPSAVAKWKAGGKIGADKLQRIAEHFGESVDWILGRSDISQSVNMNCGSLLGADCKKGLPQAGYSVDLPGAGMAERFMESSAEMNRRIDELNARIARLEMLRDPEVQKAINAYVKDALKDYFEEERRKLGKSETG